MNNIKKIGLSALAGSLVAFSANAAELSVSGGVEITYVDTGGNKGNEVTGNSFGANNGVTFKGSGDVLGGTFSMTRAINDTNTGWGSAFQTLDMGDMGIFSFDSTAGALVGLTANDDLLPTAYEESWTGVSTSKIGGVGSTNVIGYRNTVAGVSLSAGYSNSVGSAQQGESGSSGIANNASHGSVYDVYVSTSALEGLTIGAGFSVNTSTNKTGEANADTKENIMQATYAMGPVAVGYKMAQINTGTAATASTAVDGFSIAFNVNDNFAVSYGQQDAELESIAGSTAVTEESTGFSAAYTIGAASIRFNHSESSNDGNVTGTEDETTELGLALSF
jgi:outer membrane protein OmpU